MDDFEARAAALGFLKPRKYAAIERERRWLCDSFPADQAALTEAVTDLYLTNTHLRLRAMRDLASGEAIYKLAKKGDLTPDRRLITTIYLTQAEHRLFADLPGTLLHKTRHHLDQVSVDVFEGALAGLIMAEAEFTTDEEMAAFVPPVFVGAEITHDLRYTGGELIRNGVPKRA